MALQDRHLKALQQFWQAEQPRASAGIQDLLRAYARQAFGPVDPEHPDTTDLLRQQVQQLKQGRWTVLASDLVVLRARWLWLLAEQLKTAGQTLPQSWTTHETLRALEHRDPTRGQAPGCDRPEAQLRVYDGLVEDYATQTADAIRQALGAYVERQADALRRSLHLPPPDFTALHHNLSAYVSQQVWNALTQKAGREILTNPTQIRQQP